MAARTVTYQIKAAGWEFASLVGACTTVFLAGMTFAFMIFRAEHLIAAHQSGINASMYAETHIYVVIIEMVLWTIMAKASIRFKAYAHKIIDSPDGGALNLIANAMLLSFVYAILFDVASTFKTLFMGTPPLPLVTTITNLLPLSVFLTLTVLFFVGSHRLKRLHPDTQPQRRRTRQIVVGSLALFLLLLAPYAEYFYRTAPLLVDDDGLHHFSLSPPVLLWVYVLPFAVVWLLGLLSCINLAQYASRLQGKLYRPMFRSLYLGILTAYTSTYLIQVFYVSNIPSNQFGAGLLILIALIVLLMAGYGLMYRGANCLYMLDHDSGTSW